jgi:hypothetical protein
MAMSHLPSELDGNRDEAQITSEGAELIEIDGPFDLTVRPMRESLRKLYEAKGLIPKRPEAPQNPPAQSDNTPP